MQEVIKDVTAFGCCAFWKKCKLGVNPCVYEESNPAKKEACGAYKRAAQEENRTIVQSLEVGQSSTTAKESSNFDEDEDGQLTLF